MRRLCKRLGHKPRKGCMGGLPYFRVLYQGTDGLGTDHAALMATCERCGKEFAIGMIHLPKRA